MLRPRRPLLCLIAALALPLGGCQLGDSGLLEALSERFGGVASSDDFEVDQAPEAAPDPQAPQPQAAPEAIGPAGAEPQAPSHEAAAPEAAQPEAAEPEAAQPEAAEPEAAEPEAAAAAEGDPVDPRCVRWKPASGGEFVLTQGFTSGADGAPFVWSAPESGILDVCPGTFFVDLRCSAGQGPTRLDVIGASQTTTTLSGGGVGPVLSVDGCTGTFKNFTVIDGASEGPGGAASVAPGQGNAFDLFEVRFVGNQSATAGGALATGAGSVLVQSVDLVANTAPQGGAISSEGTALRLVDVELHDNAATQGDGGALALSGARLDATDVLATGNVAAGAGGALIAAGAAVELQNVTLEANEATGTDGGGLYLDGGTAFLLDLRGYGNTAAVEGGAVFFDGVTARVQNSTFEDNVAGLHGGAFGLARGAVVSNLDARWHRNTSGDWGGAAHGDSSCVFSGQNSDFGGNHPDEVYWQTYTYSWWGLNMHFSCEGRDCDPCSEWRFYKDTDGDGYGDTDDWMEGCGPARGYVADPGDCDEGDPSLNPGATEICDAVDDDCDGAVDEDTTQWHADADGDGFGDAPVIDCLPDSAPAPPGAVDDDTDCDDGDGAVNPAAAEACNSVDDDCDGGVDEGLTCP